MFRFYMYGILFLGAVGEVAGITETGHDIAVGIDVVVDYTDPKLGFFGHDALEIVDGLL